MKLIRLTQGLYALVDDEDFDWVNQWSWQASHGSRRTKWYATRKEKGVKFWMHKEIWLKRTTKMTNIASVLPGTFVIKKGMVIDHVNHFSLDNRYTIDGKPQLECITQVENMRRSPGWKKKGQKYERGPTANI